MRLLWIEWNGQQRCKDGAGLKRSSVKLVLRPTEAVLVLQGTSRACLMEMSLYGRSVGVTSACVVRGIQYGVESTLRWRKTVGGVSSSSCTASCAWLIKDMVLRFKLWAVHMHYFKALNSLYLILSRRHHSLSSKLWEAKMGFLQRYCQPVHTRAERIGRVWNPAKRIEISLVHTLKWLYLEYLGWIPMGRFPPQTGSMGGGIWLPPQDGPFLCEFCHSPLHW